MPLQDDHNHLPTPHSPSNYRLPPPTSPSTQRHFPLAPAFHPSTPRSPPPRSITRTVPLPSHHPKNSSSPTPVQHTGPEDSSNLLDGPFNSGDRGHQPVQTHTPTSSIGSPSHGRELFEATRNSEAGHTDFPFTQVEAFDHDKLLATPTRARRLTVDAADDFLTELSQDGSSPDRIAALPLSLNHTDGQIIQHNPWSIPLSSQAHDRFENPAQSSQPKALVSFDAELTATTTETELSRIRAHQSQLKSERERWKPDYLKRVARPASPPKAKEENDDNPSPRKKFKREVSLEVKNEPCEETYQVVTPTVGIAKCPLRGRVLQLLESTPGLSASFENLRLVSQDTLEWLQNPSEPRAEQKTPNPPSAADNPRMQRRLRAFMADGDCLRANPLQAINHPRQGRVLQPVAETLKGSSSDSEVDSPKWPDEYFPWSEAISERQRVNGIDREARLKLLTKFFESESDSDEGPPQRLEDEEINKSWSDVYSVKNKGKGTEKIAPLAGRGKTVALESHPRSAGTSSRRTSSSRPVFFPTDPGDALSALRSTRQARVVASQSALRGVRTKKRGAKDDEGVHCVCRSMDDGRPMVRCDGCQTWYHQICMQIYDEDELGETWFCWKCTPPSPQSSEPHSQPTFAPTADTRPSTPNQPLYLEPSPVLSSNQQLFSPPRRHGNWLEALDPVNGGPTTPYRPTTRGAGMRSPAFFEDEEYVKESAFDPTSTPSRGLRLGELRNWSVRGASVFMPGLFNTPGQSSPDTSPTRPPPPSPTPTPARPFSPSSSPVRSPITKGDAGRNV